MSPPNTQLIAIRHGETEWNNQGRFQGHMNSALNEQGLAQARALAMRLSAERIDLLISSDLGRALQTASVVAMRTGHEIVVEPRLRERRMGIFQGLTAAEVEARYPEEYARFKSRDPDYVIPGGESMRELFARSVACFSELAERYAGSTLAAVTHGGMLAMLYRHVTAMPLDAPRNFALPNTGINRLRHRGGACQTQDWGDIAHLDAALDDPEQASRDTPR